MAQNDRLIAIGGWLLVYTIMMWLALIVNISDLTYAQDYPIGQIILLAFIGYQILALAFIHSRYKLAIKLNISLFYFNVIIHVLLVIFLLMAGVEEIFEDVLRLIVVIISAYIWRLYWSISERVKVRYILDSDYGGGMFNRFIKNIKQKRKELENKSKIK